MYSNPSYRMPLKPKPMERTIGSGWPGWHTEYKAESSKPNRPHQNYGPYYTRQNVFQNPAQNYAQNLQKNFQDRGLPNTNFSDEPAPSSSWGRPKFTPHRHHVRSDIGMHLLKQMGWKQGEGLGKNKDGNIEPLTLEVKQDRKGLVSQDEKPASYASKIKKIPAVKGMQGKHPVSALNELCSKRRWSQPDFSCDQSGPANDPQFLWRCVVNGVEYQPAIPINNKKLAKIQSAQVALQSLGLVPRDNSLPIVIG